MRLRLQILAALLVGSGCATGRNYTAPGWPRFSGLHRAFGSGCASDEHPVPQQGKGEDKTQGLFPRKRQAFDIRGRQRELIRFAPQRQAS